MLCLKAQETKKVRELKKKKKVSFQSLAVTAGIPSPLVIHVLLALGGTRGYRGPILAPCLLRQKVNKHARC